MLKPKRSNLNSWHWSGTAGLNSGMQLVTSTSSNFIVGVGTGTTAIPPIFKEIDLRLFDSMPSPEVPYLFQVITERYQRGELTLGEAAEMLGMNRYQYETQLNLRGLNQLPERRTEDEIKASEALLEMLRQ